MLNHRDFANRNDLKPLARRRGQLAAAGVAALASSLAASSAWATDIDGVQPGSFDLPRIHAILQTSPTSDPLVGMDGNGLDNSYDIQGFLDTGTSGVLLSLETAQGFGVNPQVDSNNNPVTFFDVGVGGAEPFNVADQNYNVSLASFSVDNYRPLNDPPPLSAYTANAGPIRAEIRTIPTGDFDEPLNLFGTPAMQGKVAVFDPKPTNNLDFIKSYLYAPNTPFDANNADTNPGIPTVDHHVKVTQVDLSGFTSLTPPTATGPTLAPNPFIGPDPVKKLLNPTGPADPTPPVTVQFGGHATNGSFLFDSGAESSFISTNLASALHVHYASPPSPDNANPVLVDDNNNPIPNQFQEDIGGIGGAETVAGFFLSSLTLPTVEGDPINFLNAPVLVLDVPVDDGQGHSFTLDGDFGDNFWSASFGDVNASGAPMDWVTFDQQASELGFQLSSDLVPEPTSIALLGVGMTLLCVRRRRAPALS